MTDRLVDYVKAVNEDPDLQAKHDADPKGTAESFGVSPEDVQLILDKNHDEIRKRCGDDASNLRMVTLHSDV